MYGRLRSDLEKVLAEIREAGLYKEERVLGGPQGVSTVHTWTIGGVT